VCESSVLLLFGCLFAVLIRPTRVGFIAFREKRKRNGVLGAGEEKRWDGDKWVRMLGVGHWRIEGGRGGVYALMDGIETNDRAGLDLFLTRRNWSLGQR